MSRFVVLGYVASSTRLVFYGTEGVLLTIVSVWWASYRCNSLTIVSVWWASYRCNSPKIQLAEAPPNNLDFHIFWEYAVVQLKKWIRSRKLGKLGFSAFSDSHQVASQSLKTKVYHFDFEVKTTHRFTEIWWKIGKNRRISVNTLINVVWKPTNTDRLSQTET